MIASSSLRKEEELGDVLPNEVLPDRMDCCGVRGEAGCADWPCRRLEFIDVRLLALIEGESLAIVLKPSGLSCSGSTETCGGVGTKIHRRVGRAFNAIELIRQNYTQKSMHIPHFKPNY